MAIVLEEDLKRLEEMRRLTAETHWIKGSWQDWKERLTGRRLVAFRLSRKDKKEAKECWCLEGMINHVCGRSPTRALPASVYTVNDGSEVARSDVSAAAYRLAHLIWTKIKVVDPKTRANNIPGWNDNSRRKREDVLEVLDALIADGKK